MKYRTSVIYFMVAIMLLGCIHLVLSLSGVGKIHPKRETLLTKEMMKSDRIIINKKGVGELELKKSAEWEIVKPYTISADEGVVNFLLDALTLSKIQKSYPDAELAEFGKTRADYGLVDSDLTITLHLGDKTSVIHVGHETPDKKGVFVAVEGEDSVIYVVDQRIREVAQSHVNGFRSREVFPKEFVAADAFSLKRQQRDVMRFEMSNGNWVKLDNHKSSSSHPASNSVVKEFLSALMKAEVKEFVWPSELDGKATVVTPAMLASYGLDIDNAVTITFGDKGSLTRSIVLGSEAKDDYVYAFVQNSKAIVLVEKYLKELALKGDFVDSRLFPFVKSSIKSIALNDNGVDYLLAKKDNGLWYIESPILADANNECVEALLERIVTLSIDDFSEQGVAVTVDANTAKVSKDVLFSGLALADLRSLEIVKFNRKDIQSISTKRHGVEKVSAVTFNKELGDWVVSDSVNSAVVLKDAVEAVLAQLSQLKASRVEVIKTSEAQLQEYGLTNPFFTITVQLLREESIRRTISIGKKTDGGYYATMGSFDAVFVLSEEVVKNLTIPIMGE